MDGGDGWHVAAGGVGPQDKTIINRIMLRFRPIAPKPVPGGSSSGESLPESTNRSSYSPCKRAKRKYIRNKKSNRSSTGLTGDPQEPIIIDSTAITLQLLPVETASGDISGARSWLSLDRAVEETAHLTSSWVNARPFNGWDAAAGSERSMAVAAAPAPVVVVESRVTVESVTDTCMDVRGLGCTDEEKVRSLERDTCPGFISDGFNRVEWVNEAYKEMVSRQGQHQLPEVRVWLVTKAELPGKGNPAFSCRVRLQHSGEKEKCSKMVPCDVWRLEEGGGLAWRLDMKAALSLGL
uniref:uncharacterized protein LOC105349248 n=1 Tax=Fragaria vesca subsp. vesca TaxID=101020 RepID=UPI0005CAEDC2|nr:PREDICTED: uncharacterized protein LOC105349248 [Fragaria vesca subsp. vesca]